MNEKFIKIFLRISLCSAFLSAVADRFGWWPKQMSSWGTWDSFVAYTKILNPLFPNSFIPFVAGMVTLFEILLAVFLLLGFKTNLMAKISGILLLIFALSMTFTTGIKGAFDYSVFSAAAAAFSLSTFKERYWELDTILK